MKHEITIRSGNDVQMFTATGGVFLVAYDSPADGEDARTFSVIRATPKDTARAMLGQDGLNGQMLRQFAKGLADALYSVLKRTAVRHAEE